jgi:hypothetical protein
MVMVVPLVGCHLSARRFRSVVGNRALSIPELYLFVEA